MKIGPKYKIARRLGAPVFEKTQTAKFALSLQRRQKSTKRPKAKSDFGLGLNEKQKAKYVYGITERQFANYVKASLSEKGDSASHLIRKLESRLDNVVLRLGLATSRRFARQLVSHGHITVDGGIVTIPSYQVSVGEKIAIREGSKKKTVFSAIDERLKSISVPAWLKFDIEKKVGVIDGVPSAKREELLFNVATILEFYNR